MVPAMVKNIYVALISLLFAFAFGWGIGSYVAWNVDPGTWTDGGRIIDAVIIVAACILTFLGISRVSRSDRPRARARRKDDLPR